MKTGDYIKNLVVPAGLKILQSKIQINSDKQVPAFDPQNCDASGAITPNSSYKTTATNADFVLFLGTTYKSSHNYKANANFCFKGTNYFTILPKKF